MRNVGTLRYIGAAVEISHIADFFLVVADDFACIFAFLACHNITIVCIHDARVRERDSMKPSSEARTARLAGIVRATFDSKCRLSVVRKGRSRKLYRLLKDLNLSLVTNAVTKDGTNVM